MQQQERDLLYRPLNSRRIRQRFQQKLVQMKGNPKGKVKLVVCHKCLAEEACQHWDAQSQNFGRGATTTAN